MNPRSTLPGLYNIPQGILGILQARRKQVQKFGGGQNFFPASKLNFLKKRQSLTTGTLVHSEGLACNWDT